MYLLKLKKPLPERACTGYLAFKIYCAMKAHYNGQFDASTFTGKLRIPIDTYNKRQDKVFFERIASKLDAATIYEMIAYNFVSNPDALSYEIAGSGCYHFYRQYLGHVSSISTAYEDDLKTIFNILSGSGKTFTDLLGGDGHPVILQMAIRGDICIETIILIDSFLPIIEKMNRDFENDIIWIEWHKRIIQYSKLLDINKTLAKDEFTRVKKLV